MYQVKKKEAEKVIEPKNVEEKIEETKSLPIPSYFFEELQK